jgi:GNAT superfamily N-acetyltransferase
MHARGRLLPFGWLRLLRAARRIDHARVLLLGVRPEWRGRGVAALLAAAMADAGRAIGIASAELSLVQSDNRSMRTVIEGFAARRVKRFALFARELGP